MNYPVDNVDKSVDNLPIKNYSMCKKIVDDVHVGSVDIVEKLNEPHDSGLLTVITVWMKGRMKINLPFVFLHISVIINL